MKQLNLAVIVAALILLVSGSAIAEDESKKMLSNQPFTGQRPYMKAPEQDKVYKAEDPWEGATLVTDESPDEATANKGQAKHQQLRLNFLGKRPYMENYPD